MQTKYIDIKLLKLSQDVIERFKVLEFKFMQYLLYRKYLF